MKTTGLALALIVLAPCLLRAGEADSLQYSRVRAELLSGPAGVDSVLLETADELAAAELYEDALSLLRDLGGSIDTAGANTAAAPPDRAPPRWRLCLTGDYVRIEDVADTSGLSRAERDSVRRLLDEAEANPLDIYLTGSVALPRPAPAIEKLEPAVHLGNRRGRAGIAVDMGAAGAPVRAQVEVGAEKRLWHERTDTAAAAAVDTPGVTTTRVFAPSEAHPQDLVDGRLRVEFAPPGRERRVAWRAPLEVRPVVYRHNRAGYRSHIDYRLGPAIELRSADLRTQLAVEAAAEYRDCFDPDRFGTYSPAADSLDAFRAGPGFVTDVWLERVSINLEGAYEYARYPNRGAPRSVHELTGRGRIETTVTEMLRSRLSVNARRLREDHIGLSALQTKVLACPPYCPSVEVSDTTVLADRRFTLRGGELTLAPGMAVHLRSLVVTLTVPWRLRRYARLDSVPEGRLLAPAYIDESTDAFEPEIRLSYGHEVVQVRTWCAWLVEEVLEKWNEERADSRGVAAGLDLSVNPFDHLSVQGRLDYRFRKEKPGPAAIRDRRNVTASLRCCLTP